MKKVSKGIVASVLVFICVAIPTILMAQPSNFDTSDGADPGDITDVPVNGGTIFLIVAGLALAIYRLYRVYKANTQLAIAK